jgi:hypothetical protein
MGGVILGCIFLEGLQQAGLAGAGNGFGAAVHIQLAVDALEMLVDGFRNHEKGCGDFLVRETLCQEPQHIHTGNLMHARPLSLVELLDQPRAFHKPGAQRRNG